MAQEGEWTRWTNESSHVQLGEMNHVRSDRRLVTIHSELSL